VANQHLNQGNGKGREGELLLQRENIRTKERVQASVVPSALTVEQFTTFNVPTISVTILNHLKPTNNRISLEVPSTATIKDICTRLCEIEKLDAGQFYLQYAGKSLYEEWTLDSINFHKEDTLNMYGSATPQ